MQTAAAMPPQPAGQAANNATGAWLVLGSALVWSAGGLLVRLADVDSP